MIRQSKVIANFGPLKAITDDVRANKNARVKVGILQGGSRNGPGAAYIERHNLALRRGWLKKAYDFGDKTNAEVGLIHEFGSASLHIPQRSFLRMPLESELPKKLRVIGGEVWRSLIEMKGLYNALESLGLSAVATVSIAFSTRGYGRWQNNSWVTTFIKQSSEPLIDSGQLRRAISHAVVGGKRP